MGGQLSPAPACHMQLFPFQQLLYQRNPVAFDVAESMMPGDVQSGAAELRKERKGLLRSSAPTPMQLFMSCVDHSRERRSSNGQHPFRREIKTNVGVKRKNTWREQTDILLVGNL